MEHLKLYLRCIERPVLPIALSINQDQKDRYKRGLQRRVALPLGVVLRRLAPFALLNLPIYILLAPPAPLVKTNFNDNEMGGEGEGKQMSPTRLPNLVFE